MGVCKLSNLVDGDPKDYLAAIMESLKNAPYDALARLEEAKLAYAAATRDPHLRINRLYWKSDTWEGHVAYELKWVQESADRCAIIPSLLDSDLQGICSAIPSDVSMSGSPVPAEDVDSVQRGLGVIFAEDYRNYLRDHSCLTICNASISWESIPSLMDEVRSCVQLPDDWYVLCKMFDYPMAAKFYVQDGSGVVYVLMRDRNGWGFVPFAPSLKDFVVSLWVYTKEGGK